MMGNWTGWEMMNGWNNAGFGYGLGLLLIWSAVWKGLALWRAAREGSKPWFIAFLVLNTAGIVEIIYLFFFAKEKLSFSSKPKAKSRKK